MINNYLEVQIRSNFEFEPTTEQNTAIAQLAQFLSSTGEREVFLLRGYAGTGKTTLVGALVKTLTQLEQRTVLMAPTGRAAKVFSAYAGQAAYTIHKRIYRQKSITDTDSFSLNENLLKRALFVVDEASMIANEGLSGSMFGSGRLLDDLLHFVYSGEGCRLLLMGDTAQLPPVGEEESPALSAEVLQHYGLRVWQITLTQVMRQLQSSGVLLNATALRNALVSLPAAAVPLSGIGGFQLHAHGFPDVHLLNGEQLIEQISTCYDRDGIDQTMIICRSNKRAILYNRGVRGTIFYREEELTTGDQLMVVKNNYYWIEKVTAEEKQNQPLPFIANGDIAVIRRIRHTQTLYGFRFAEVLLAFPDYEDYELDTIILLDTLLSEAPALTREDSERFFAAVMEDYEELPRKTDRFKRLRENPYYNALQVKYAYAVTCHKAQGGQWKNIFLDLGYLPPDTLASDYYRWLYTAITRTTDHLYLVNWPKEQLSGADDSSRE